MPLKKPSAFFFDAGFVLSRRHSDIDLVFRKSTRFLFDFVDLAGKPKEEKAAAKQTLLNESHAGVMETK